MVASLFCELSAAGFVVSSDQLSSKQGQPSPRSTRRRLMFTKKLFQGEAFYLDLRTTSGSRIRSQVEVDLKLLGGHVEAFLSKEVTHLITDRTDILSSVTNSASSHSANSRSNDNKNGRSSPAVFSRAQALLNKSVSKQQAKQNVCANVSDPISLAKQWGIRITTLQKVLSIIEREKSKCDPNRKMTNGKNDFKIKCRKFEGPFIKIEDSSGQYKPSSKSFNSFPVIDIQNPDIAHEQSPFIARKRKPKQKTEKCNDVNVRPNLADSSDDNNAPDEKRNEAKIPQAAWTPKATQAATPKTGVKPKIQSGYCESCDKSYQNLKEHIKSDLHLNFAKNNGNFLNLDSVITKLPSLDEMMNKLDVGCGNNAEKLCQISEKILSEEESNLKEKSDTECSHSINPVLHENQDIKQTKVTDDDETDAFEIKPEVRNSTLKVLTKAERKQVIHIQPVFLQESKNNCHADVFSTPTGGAPMRDNELTMPYEKTCVNTSQQKDTSFAETDQPITVTSQTDKNSTFAYEENCLGTSFLEDTQGNQVDQSVSANVSLVIETGKSQLNESVNKTDTECVSSELRRTKNIDNSSYRQNEHVQTNEQSLNINQDTINAIKSLLPNSMRILDNHQECQSEPVVTAKLDCDKDALIIPHTDKIESPFKKEKIKDLSESSVQAVLKELNFLNESGAHIDSMQSQMSVSQTQEFTQATALMSCDDSTIASKTNLEAFSKFTDKDLVKPEQNTHSENSEINGVVQFINEVEDLTNGDFEMMQHVAPILPSESNDATMQEPLSSRGDHFDISPIKLLTKFQFGNLATHTELPNDGSNSGSARGNPQLISVKSGIYDDISNSNSGQNLISKNSHSGSVDNTDSFKNDQSCSQEGNGNSRLVCGLKTRSIDRINKDESDAILPDSVTTSETSSYPTSFNNILSNLSGGVFPLEKNISQESPLIQSSKTHSYENGSGQAALSNMGPIASLEKEGQLGADSEPSPMDCSSQHQNSSDAVENSIAMNLMEKLKNKDFDVSESDSEFGGFLSGAKVPSDIDLDTISLSTRKLPELDAILCAGDSTFVPNSQSSNNLVLPLDTNLGSKNDSQSLIIPQVFTSAEGNDQMIPKSVPVMQNEIMGTPETTPVIEKQVGSQNIPKDNSEQSISNIVEENRSNMCGFDLNQNKYSHLSFAELAKNAKDAFPNKSSPIKAIHKENSLFESEKHNHSSENNQMNTGTTKTKPWSPSMILNDASREHFQVNAKSTLTNVSENSIYLKEKVLLEPNSNILRSQKEGRKSSKEKPIKKQKDAGVDDSLLDKQSLYNFTKSFDFESSQTPTVRKTKKKKSKELCANKDIESSTGNNLCKTPKSKNKKEKFVTPKSHSLQQPLDMVQSPDCLWKVTPSKGLKIKLSRVRVEPLGQENEMCDQLTVTKPNKNEEKPKHSKVKKGEKEKKPEKSKKRRKLDL